MDKTWMDVLIYVVEVVLGLVVSAGIPYLFSIIRKKISGEVAMRYINLAEGYLTDAVKMTNQTFVNYLKETGNFDDDAKKEAFEKTKAAWLAMMSDHMKIIILDNVGDIEEYINSKIESAVYDEKLASEIVV